MMKKILLLVMMCVFFIGISAVSFADQLAGWERESIKLHTDVHAVVEPFASVTWSNTPYLEFEGRSNERSFASLGLTVTSNAAINFDFSGTKLTQCNDDGSAMANPDSIDTTYDWGFWHYHATSTNPATWYGYSTNHKGTNKFIVGIEGQIGGIDDQSAGSYKSTIQVTVKSPLKRPAWDEDYK
jgi:hypothetical protein